MELGDAVDRKGLSCYGAVYAIYSIAYALRQSGFAAVASDHLSFLLALLCVSGALIAFVPVLMLRQLRSEYV